MKEVTSYNLAVFTSDDGDGGEGGGHLALHEEFKRTEEYKQLKPVLDSIAQEVEAEEDVRFKSIRKRFTNSNIYAANFFFQVRQHIFNTLLLIK